MSQAMTAAVLIAGCGDIGRRIASHYLGQGVTVTGLVKSTASAARNLALDIGWYAGDLDRPAMLTGLPAAGARVFYLAPPPAAGTDDPRVAHFIAALDPQLPPLRVVYVSTTGVYGDQGGAWVTEDTPPQPRTERGKRRLAAENHWREYAARTGARLTILRVPGIYGPGRLPVERLQQRLPVLHAGESPYSNRIHAEDLAAVCIAAAEHSSPGALYNVADDDPSTMTDYFFRVADTLGLPRPPTVNRAQAEQALSAGLRSFMAESRRIDNRRMKAELAVTLRYPDLATGLAALADRP